MFHHRNLVHVADCVAQGFSPASSTTRAKHLSFRAPRALFAIARFRRDETCFCTCSAGRNLCRPVGSPASFRAGAQRVGLTCFSVLGSILAVARSLPETPAHGVVEIKSTSDEGWRSRRRARTGGFPALRGATLNIYDSDYTPGVPSSDKRYHRCNLPPIRSSCPSRQFISGASPGKFTTKYASISFC